MLTIYCPDIRLQFLSKLLIFSPDLGDNRVRVILKPGVLRFYLVIFYGHLVVAPVDFSQIAVQVCPYRFLIIY